MDEQRAKSGYCYWCGEPLTPETRTDDHLTPKARGGTDDPSNIVDACFSCNAQKGDRTAEEYRIWREAMGMRSPQFSTYCSYLEEQFAQFKNWKFPEAVLLCQLIAERIKGLQTRTTESNAEFIDEHIRRLTAAVLKIGMKNLAALKRMDRKPSVTTRQEELKKQLRQIGATRA
jgi:hypothetical protein